MCKFRMYIAAVITCIINAGVIIMFDVQKPEMVNKTFRMPTELVAQLSELAQNKKVSLNYLVIQCCEYALKNLDINNTEQE